MGSNTSASSSIPPRGDLAKEERPLDCPHKMENSPATFDAASGTYMVLITEFRSPDSPPTFDVIQWMSGERAREAFEQDTGDPHGPPNDYYIRNESKQTRSAPFADGALVLITHFAQGGGYDLEQATLEEFASYLRPNPDHAPYWLTFDNGKITQACEQWTP